MQAYDTPIEASRAQLSKNVWVGYRPTKKSLTICQPKANVQYRRILRVHVRAYGTGTVLIFIVPTTTTTVPVFATCTMIRTHHCGSYN